MNQRAGSRGYVCPESSRTPASEIRRCANALTVQCVLTPALPALTEVVQRPPFGGMRLVFSDLTLGAWQSNFLAGEVLEQLGGDPISSPLAEAAGLPSISERHDR